MEKKILLNELVTGILTYKLPFNPIIEGLSYALERARKNFLHFSWSNSRYDVRSRIEDLVEVGVACLCSDFTLQNCDLITISVKDVKGVMRKIAAKFWEYPYKKLYCIGVTGTKGKTTVASLIDQLFALNGISSCYIGTRGFRYTGTLIENLGITTPESVDLYRYLSMALYKGAKVASLEVSSHSLVQGRLGDMDFSIGVFTNLFHDHLDYHRDMQNYFLAKTKLFEISKVKIVSIRTSWGRELVKDLNKKGEQKIVKVGQGGDLWFEGVDFSLDGTLAKFYSYRWGEFLVSTRLVGIYNLHNLELAVAALLVYGLPLQDVIKSIGMLQPIPGRMEVVVQGDVNVIVDYAHTPESLEYLLESVRKLTKGRIILVFGCGGDRDREKRPLMGKIAVENADFVIITEDNTRKEDPTTILREIADGIPAGYENFTVIKDRKRAIEYSKKISSLGDTVIVAGKGEERYIEGPEGKREFDDREVCKEIFNG